MQIAILSGSRWGATAGGQRYQQLALKLQKYLPDETRIVFRSFVRAGTPPEMDAIDRPFFDAVIVGFAPLYYSEYHLVKQFNPYCTIIYDVCDYWRGGHMIEGVDLSADDEKMANEANVIVGVNTSLLSHYLPLNKPLYVVPNGLRDDFLSDFNFPITNEVHCYWWGSHFQGQTWLDLECLKNLPQLFPKLRFHYFFASDWLTPEFFGNQPNLEVHISSDGIAPQEFFIRIKLPAIGLVPFKPLNSAAFHADPIKIYEYWALGFVVIATNTWSSLGERKEVHFCWGDPTREISRKIEEILNSENFRLEPPPLEERLRYSWDERAKTYASILLQYVRS